jgi:hypothetical protein
MTVLPSLHWTSTVTLLRSSAGPAAQKINSVDTLEQSKREKHAIEYKSFLLFIYPSSRISMMACIHSFSVLHIMILLYFLHLSDGVSHIDENTI